jgi:hypothetical protein
MHFWGKNVFFEAFLRGKMGVFGHFGVINVPETA